MDCFRWICFLTRVEASLGSTAAGFMRLPSLFWFAHSDGVLQATAWSGFGLSCVVVAGYANAIIMTLLWVLYMSIRPRRAGLVRLRLGNSTAGNRLPGHFPLPAARWPAFPKRAPPLRCIWLFRWLIFRIMLGAALIKLRGDSCWRDLTALYYHFETQPIPNPLSRFFHFLPHWMLKGGVLFNYLAELVAPWFAFYPRLARHIAGVIMVAFQVHAHPGRQSFLSELADHRAGAGLFRRRFLGEVAAQAR